MTPEATAPASSAADAIVLETRAVVISLTAKDLLETVAWYRDVLGFNVEYQMDRGPPRHLFARVSRESF